MNSSSISTSFSDKKGKMVGLQVTGLICSKSTPNQNWLLLSPKTLYTLWWVSPVISPFMQLMFAKGNCCFDCCDWKKFKIGERDATPCCYMSTLWRRWLGRGKWCQVLFTSMLSVLWEVESSERTIKSFFYCFRLRFLPKMYGWVVLSTGHSNMLRFRIGGEVGSRSACWYWNAEWQDSFTFHRQQSCSWAAPKMKNMCITKSWLIV